MVIIAFFYPAKLVQLEMTTVVAATSGQQIWECLTTEVHGEKPISWLIVSIAAGVARVKYFLYVNIHTFILSPYY